MRKYLYFIVLALCACGNYNFGVYNNNNIVNVKDFGAKGDGITDDTKSIQDAISYGAKRGAKVVFTKGIYMVNSLDINISVEGGKDVVIKRIVSKHNGQYDFCTIKKQNNLFVKNIVFDANSNSEKNKGIPLFIYSSKNIKVEDCEFLNSSMAGLRIESSSYISIDRSNAYGSSGNSGDGFYFTRSKNITVRNSSATNYSRIGFVVEDNSSEITFDNCQASLGTNASILSGGTEYNAGFWYENSTNVYTKNCIASKNTHRGFVAASSNKGSGVATFNFDNCISEDNPIGFSLSSKGEIPVNIKVSNSKVINVERGFVATARNLNDTFIFENCEAYMKKIPAGALNNIGFMWESPVSKDKKVYKTLPTFSYLNSKVFYDKDEQLQSIKNSQANNGDISTYTGGKAKIIIKGMTNSITGDNLILKARRGEPQYIQD